MRWSHTLTLVRAHVYPSSVNRVSTVEWCSDFRNYECSIHYSPLLEKYNGLYIFRLLVYIVNMPLLEYVSYNFRQTIMHHIMNYILRILLNFIDVLKRCWVIRVPVQIPERENSVFTKSISYYNARVLLLS